MLTEGLYLAVVALFFSHELDAVRRHEWRLLPLLNRLEEQRGYAVFAFAHIPLFAAVIWFSFVPGFASPAFRTGLAVFAVIHVGLHLLYARHPANEFGNPLSQALIWGAGIAGGVYLLFRAAGPGGT